MYKYYLSVLYKTSSVSSPCEILKTPGTEAVFLASMASAHVFIHGGPEFSSQDRFTVIQCLLLSRVARSPSLVQFLQKANDKTSSDGTKEPLTLQDTERGGNCWVKSFLQEAAQQQCMLCGITAPLTPF